MAAEKRVIIVARERKTFFDFLTGGFGEAGLRVILDRRQARRRARDRGLQLSEKRRHDRRSRPQVDVQLRSVGFATVNLD